MIDFGFAEAGKHNTLLEYVHLYQTSFPAYWDHAGLSVKQRANAKYNYEYLRRLIHRHVTKEYGTFPNTGEEGSNLFRALRRKG